MPYEFDREHSCIEVATAARPRAVLGGGTYPVTNISEQRYLREHHPGSAR